MAPITWDAGRQRRREGPNPGPRASSQFYSSRNGGFKGLGASNCQHRSGCDCGSEFGICIHWRITDVSSQSAVECGFKSSCARRDAFVCDRSDELASARSNTSACCTSDNLACCYTAGHRQKCARRDTAGPRQVCTQQTNTANSNKVGPRGNTAASKLVVSKSGTGAPGQNAATKRDTAVPGLIDSQRDTAKPRQIATRRGTAAPRQVSSRDNTGRSRQITTQRNTTGLRKITIRRDKAVCQQITTQRNTTGHRQIATACDIAGHRQIASQRNTTGLQQIAIQRNTTAQSQENTPLIADLDNLAFLRTQTRISTTRPTTGTEARHSRGKPHILSFLTFLLTSHAHLAVSATPSRPPSSSHTNTRYVLVPTTPETDNIFLYFNPPSILNLKINTRQSVDFNFTLHRRHARLTSTFSNLTTTSKTTIDNYNTSKPTHLFSGFHQNDETSDISTTTTTNSTESHLISFLQTQSSTLISNSTSKSAKQTNFRSKEVDDRSDWNSSIYWVMIYSDDDTIARPIITSPNGLAIAHADSRGSYILMAVSAGRQHNFSIEARHIGRVTMSVAVVDVHGERKMPQANYVQAVAASQYTVTAVRGERTADLVFNSSAAAIAIIISFGIGAVTDTDSLKRQLKFPVSLIIGFCCQFILVPVMAFGIAMLLPLDKDILFGLLCVACVPGGGISHVAVIIADGDIALSLTMNLICVVAMLGTAPLWIFVLGQYFDSDPHEVLNRRTVPIYSFEIWFASIFFAYIGGLIIKRLRPAVADAILMWLIKPFLLLASILYITLGVYINMYVFELVNGYALLGAMLLPFSGCVLGGLLAAICRQNYAYVKTIALETSSLNCLVVMVAIRFSLKQPDADLAAVIPIWVMFTIPGFFVFLAICNKFKSILLHFWKNRNGKDTEVHSSSKAYSVSSSVASPPGTTTLSAPLVTTDGLDDDATISTMSNQKVTVL